jgi:hypothetical protein
VNISAGKGVRRSESGCEEGSTPLDCVVELPPWPGDWPLISECSLGCLIISLSRPPFLRRGCIDFGIGSEGRRASVSCTVRMCFASASDRVNARSHSKICK